MSKSIIGSAEKAAVLAVLDQGFLGTGPETQAFEQELEAYFGGGMGVTCVSSGTAALHLAVQACGIGPGDEVLIPTLTYVASFQAVSAAGAQPVACDVLDECGLLDLRDAERKLSPRTKAVMPVHYASYPGDLQAVYAFAQRNGLRVIEDAAHAFGCVFEGRRVGSIGDLVCFSFDGIKNITSGEGGAVVTRDATVIRRVRDARLLGVENDTESRYRKERTWEFNVGEQGWRYHMSDIMAALGRVQLRRFESEFRPKRIALARRYRERLAGLSGVGLFVSDLGPTVPHIQPVRVRYGRRDVVRAVLNAANIQTGLHYKPNHLLTKFSRPPREFPVAEKIYAELLTLPLHPDITINQVDSIVDLISKTVSANQ